MEYKNMTDEELVDLYYRNAYEPIEQIDIARHIKDEKTRTLLLSRAKKRYYEEDEERD